LRFGLLSSLLSVWLTVLPRATARAEAPPSQTRLDLRFAAGVASVRENLLTPLAATGPAVELATRFAWSALRLRVEADARLGLAALFDRLGEGSPTAHHELGVAVLARRPVDAALDAGLSFGGVARLASDVTYFEPWDDAHAYWLAVASLGPAVRYARALPNGRWLVARADVTLVALASRPPARRLNKQDAQNHVSYYFDRLGQDPSWVAPWGLQQGRAELALCSATAEGRAEHGRWTFGAEVRFSRAAEPRPYDNLYYGLFFGWGTGG
jgi:hypothetical protein